MRIRHAVLLAFAVFALAACGVLPMLPPPAPVERLDPGATIPPGAQVRTEDASLADAARTLILSFTGGPPWDPDDPCSTAYVGWASPDGDDLDAAVIDVTPDRPLLEGTACSALGYPRTVNVALAEPFAGFRVRDLAGPVHFVRAPDGLVTLTTLPAGWRLSGEGNLPDSPNGAWRRTYAADVNGIRLDRLEVVQSYGRPASLGKGTEIRQVTLNGVPASLYREPESGVLELAWMLDGDGITLSANAASVPEAQLIEIAEGIRHP